MRRKSAFFVAMFAKVCFISLCRFSALAQTDPPSQEKEPTMVLHVETREAAIDVVAHDRRNLPITDLTANDFQVFEISDHGSKISRRILYLSTIDPEHTMRERDAVGGLRVRSGAVCAQDAEVHYRITIEASPEPGYHTVQVKTTRPRVSLNFRQKYYVGYTEENATPKTLKKLVTPDALQEAACYHPLAPPTLAVTVSVLGDAGGKATRFVAVIKPGSPSQIGVSQAATNGGDPHVQLDFGMCVFNADGEAAGYLHTSLDQAVNDADRARIRDHGFVGLLDVPGSEPPVLARLAVLDRNTGNVRTADVFRLPSVLAQSGDAKPQPRFAGDLRAFGSVIPSEGAFCGDVYELPEGTTSLSAMQELDPIGSLYTGALDVPEQNITRMGGIPGFTHSPLWFGIDYYGRFFVTKPGEYLFELQSDDGSRLEIDNQPLIDSDGIHRALEKTAGIKLSGGWHSIHVPYVQGPPTSVALVLRIQPPGESMRPFNLGEFVQPKTDP